MTTGVHCPPVDNFICLWQGCTKTVETFQFHAELQQITIATKTKNPNIYLKIFLLWLKLGHRFLLDKKQNFNDKANFFLIDVGLTLTEIDLEAVQQNISPVQPRTIPFNYSWPQVNVLGPSFILFVLEF